METNTVATRPKSPPPAKGKPLREVLASDYFRSQAALALPKYCTPERFQRVAITCITRTPLLAECDQTMLLGQFMTLASLGIEADGRRAHLIPFRNNKRGCYESQLIIDYKGLVELVMRSGDVSYLHADTVCDNDAFEYNLGQIVQHKIDWRKPRGEVYAVYALARLKSGEMKCEVMSRDDVEQIRARSRAGQIGPWCTDWAEMAKKTVFRRLTKWLPWSPEVRDAIEADDEPALPQARVVPAEPDKIGWLAPVVEQPSEPDSTPDEQAEADAGLAPAAPSSTAATAAPNNVGTLRAFCHRDGVEEAAVLRWAIASGIVDDSLASFDDVEKIKPRALASWVKSWDAVKADATKGGAQ